MASTTFHAKYIQMVFVWIFNLWCTVFAIGLWCEAVASSSTIRPMRSFSIPPWRIGWRLTWKWPKRCSLNGQDDHVQNDVWHRVDFVQLHIKFKLLSRFFHFKTCRFFVSRGGVVSNRFLKFWIWSQVSKRLRMDGKDPSCTRWKQCKRWRVSLFCDVTLRYVGGKVCCVIFS